jgi:hypothetical protein
MGLFFGPYEMPPGMKITVVGAHLPASFLKVVAAGGKH